MRPGRTTASQGQFNAPHRLFAARLDELGKGPVLLGVFLGRAGASAGVALAGDLLAAGLAAAEGFARGAQTQAAEGIIEAASGFAVFAFGRAVFDLLPAFDEFTEIVLCPFEFIQQCRVGLLLLVFEILQHHVGGLAGVFQVGLVAARFDGRADGIIRPLLTGLAAAGGAAGSLAEHVVGLAGRVFGTGRAVRRRACAGVFAGGGLIART